MLLASGDLDAALTQASMMPLLSQSARVIRWYLSRQKDNEKAVRAYENAWSLVSASWRASFYAWS